MSIVLQARDLHWLKGGSDGGDLCAHGHVDFRVNGEVPADWEDFELSVSAAALYLLRTLERDTPVSVSEDEIFPCCGHAMYESEDSDDVLILGCNVHNTFMLRHADGHIELDIGTGTVHRLGADEWRAAVFAFADQVAALYRTSAPRVKPADPVDAAGYAAFLREWEARRGVALV